MFAMEEGHGVFRGQFQANVFCAEVSSAVCKKGVFPMAKKYVYLFKEGNANMRELLGGKGANLAEMTNIGLPVPQGFTITTEACTQYYEDGRKINDEIMAQVMEGVKKMEEIKVVTSGAGAAGIAIIKLLIAMGLKNVILCDRKGAIYEGREGLNKEKEEMAKITNRDHEAGTLAEVLKGADVFIGVSAPGCVTQDMVRSMNENPILFPMANPTPEIMPDLAKEAGAAVVGTGRSDFPNQINNVLAFPGIFRGALDVRASEINDEMKIAAAKAIASFVTDDLLSADYIIPSALDKNVATAVAEAVAKVAKETGVARI